MFKSGFTVWYNVSNLLRTVEFYNKKLGFEIAFIMEEGGMASVYTNTEECTIGFSEVKEVIPSTSSTVFEVINIEAAVERLKEAGVAFIGEIETIPGMVKLASFTDPDGHNLMLSESLMQPESAEQA
jgi:predicted enzyme related to lactoylglutathione lyase